MFKRKRKFRSDFLDNMGLVVGRDWAMCYGMNHGALRWAPEWVKHSICSVWNWCACHIKGHDPVGVELYTAHMVPGCPRCVNCGASLKINGKHPTQEEIDANDDICYSKFEEYDSQLDKDTEL